MDKFSSTSITITITSSNFSESVSVMKNKIRFQTIRDLIEDYNDPVLRLELEHPLLLSKMFSNDYDYFDNLSSNNKVIDALILLEYLPQFLLDYQPGCPFRNFLFENLNLDSWNDEMIAKYSGYLQYFYSCSTIYLTKTVSDEDRRNMLNQFDMMNFFDNISNNEFSRINNEINKYMMKNFGSNYESNNNYLLVNKHTLNNQESSKQWLISPFTEWDKSEIIKDPRLLLLQDDEDEDEQKHHNTLGRYMLTDQLFLICPEYSREIRKVIENNNEKIQFFKRKSYNSFDMKISPDGKYCIIIEDHDPRIYLVPLARNDDKINEFDHVRTKSFFCDFITIDGDGNYAVVAFIQSYRLIGEIEKHVDCNEIELHIFYSDKVEPTIFYLPDYVYMKLIISTGNYYKIEYNWKYDFYIISCSSKSFIMKKDSKRENFLCYVDCDSDGYRQRLQLTKCNEYLISVKKIAYCNTLNQQYIKMKVFKCNTIDYFTEQLDPIFEFERIVSEHLILDDLLSWKLDKFIKARNDIEVNACSDSDSECDNW